MIIIMQPSELDAGGCSRIVLGGLHAHSGALLYFNVNDPFEVTMADHKKTW